MLTSKEQEELIAVTPRKARDSSKYRAILQKQLTGLDRERDSLLFDLTGELEVQLLTGNPEIQTLENQFWELIKKVFVENKASKKEEQEALNLFSFSKILLKIFKQVKPERIDLLKDPSLLSFCILPQFQQNMIKCLKGETYFLPKATADESYQIKFWSCIYMLLKTDHTNTQALNLGLFQELIDLILEPQYFEIMPTLIEFPIKLKPRCSEEVIANIISPQNEDLIQELLELKYIQIISGKDLDAQELINKFAHLKELGFI